MLRFAVSFGADNVIWLDRAQTRAYWQAYNELPPPTMYGSDNMIAVRGRFAIPILDGVGCRVWPVRPGGEHERALDQVLNGGPEL